MIIGSFFVLLVRAKLETHSLQYNGIAFQFSNVTDKNYIRIAKFFFLEKNLDYGKFFGTLKNVFFLEKNGFQIFFVIIVHVRYIEKSDLY